MTFLPFFIAFKTTWRTGVILPVFCSSSSLFIGVWNLLACAECRRTDASEVPSKFSDASHFQLQRTKNVCCGFIALNAVSVASALFFEACVTVTRHTFLCYIVVDCCRSSWLRTIAMSPRSRFSRSWFEFVSPCNPINPRPEQLFWFKIHFQWISSHTFWRIIQLKVIFAMHLVFTS